MTTYSPHAHALLMNIVVMHHELSRFLGLWLPTHKTVLLRPGMSTRLERCVLAHELGHAVLHHTGTSEATEREANLWAAALLVSPEKLETARGEHPDCPERYARLCDVSTEIMDAYLSAEDLMPTWRALLLENPIVAASHRLDWTTMGEPTDDGHARRDEGPIAHAAA